MRIPADMHRELQRFLRMARIHDLEALQAVIKEMKETARHLGMSEDEMCAIYEADDLMDLYRKTLARRH